MSENLKAFLGCPCTEIPAGTPSEKIMEVYQAAKARSVKEGFVPVLISDADWEEDAEIPREKSPAEYLKELRAAMPDSKTFFEQRAAYFKEEMEEEGFSWLDEAVLGPMEGGEPIDRFLGICNYRERPSLWCWRKSRRSIPGKSSPGCPSAAGTNALPMRNRWPRQNTGLKNTARFLPS